MQINASKLSLDKPAAEWTPKTLHGAFVKHGCAIVRQAVPRHLLLSVHDAIEAAYTKTDDLHVYDKDIKKESRDALSGFELVATPLLQEFLAIVYAGQKWDRYNVTARRISGVEENKDWQKPLDLHLDSEFHSFGFTTNFWIPFQECGVDCPTLQLVPLDHMATREYSGYTGKRLSDAPWNKGYFDRKALEIESVVSAFGENCFLRPTMSPGDLILASNWILHGSYRTPEMRKGRTSAEVRFIGERQTLDANHRDPILFRIRQAIRNWR